VRGLGGRGCGGSGGFACVVTGGVGGFVPVLTGVGGLGASSRGGGGA
jgi:hypothetical protein